MKIIKSLIGLSLLLLPVGGLQAQLVDKKILTLEAAEKIAAAAEAEAKKRNATVVIVVVDDGGYPFVLKRLDDTQVASVDVGIGKARTAAIFRRPSKDFEDQIKSGRVASLVLPGATPLQGGVPLVFDGKVIGAIGESRVITKGDLIVVPNGTPHWFKEVNGPINYYVVKVRSAN
jgi:glc operon protein GlcG